MTRFDESDPRFLVIYEGHEHGRSAEYEAWLGKWAAWLEKPERFGVILVVHEHHHDEDEDDHGHKRDGDEEDAISRMLSAFRRDYRELVNEKTLGYTAVFSPRTVQSWQVSDPDIWQKVQTRYEQFSYYMWGIRGRAFTDLDEAKIWLSSLADEPPLPLEIVELDTAVPINQNVGLYYGSTTGTTEIVAEKIQTAWQNQYGDAFPLANISDLAAPEDLLAFEYLILGVPTWNIGKLQDDWAIFLPHLDEMDLTGKRAALFGVGDQYGYPENFQDALGILGTKLRERGAELVGLWDTAGYEFDYSAGVENGRFLGLAIDERNQPHLTEPRIQQWIAEISQQFSGVSIQAELIEG